MVEWLVQSIADHPALAQGIAPAGLLSEQEQLRLAELKTAKRRSDWLIGRWTAKHLLQSYIERRTGIRPQVNTLTVANDPDGAPRVIADCGLQRTEYERNLRSTMCNLQVSISHSDGRAFCAIAIEPGIRLGVDIERVESRAWQFVEDYFTDEEVALVRRAPLAERDTFVTAIWSAKEAALKALRLGLSVDTRSVSCLLCVPERADGWTGFDSVCDRRLLGVPAAPPLTGWWRTMDGFVLTIVVMHNANQH